MSVHMEFDVEEIGVENDIDNQYAGQMLRNISKDTDLRDIKLVAGIDRQRYE